MCNSLAIKDNVDIDQLYKIISTCLFKPVESLSASDSLVYDLHVDSMVLTEIVVSIEDFFNIEIFNDEAEQLVSVSDVVTLVRRKLPSK